MAGEACSGLLPTTGLKGDAREPADPDWLLDICSALPPTFLFLALKMGHRVRVSNAATK